MLATGFDRANQIRNLTQQIIYKTQSNQIKLSSLVFPNTHLDTMQTYTSGLITLKGVLSTADYLNARIRIECSEDDSTNSFTINDQISLKCFF